VTAAVKPTPRSEWNDGYGTDSGPSGGDSCRRAFRPIEASRATIGYVRNTSTPAVSFAQIAAIHGRRGDSQNCPWKPHILREIIVQN
jgi:hypothetical protein